MPLDDINTRRLRRLAETVEKIAAVHDIHELFAIVRSAVRELTGADGATLVLRDDGKCHYADEDAIGPLWKGQRFPLESCISGWTMLHAEATVIEDIYVDPRIPHAAYRPTFVKSLSMVPVGRDKPVGAIGCYWAHQHKASAEEVELQQAMADAMSVGLANIDLYQQMALARQAAEQAARQAQASEAAMQAAQRLAGVGSWERNINSVEYAVWTDEMYHIYGHDRALGPDKFPNLQQAYTAESWVIVSAAIERCATEGTPYACDAELIHPDGSHRWVIARGLAVRDEKGNITGMRGTLQDITQRRQAEQEIRQLNAELEQRVEERTAKLAAANRAKDSFLATMSHEIRTPLTGMLGMLELLSLTALDNEQSMTLDAARDSGRGLLRIVNDILDWSKIEEGKLELSPSATSISQLLKDVVNTYSHVASAKALRLVQHCDNSLGPGHIVDPLRLSQVLNNFISNAIKFTQHGEIELRADLVERQNGKERIRFSVRDTGMGIAPEIQEQLFQRYRQGSANTARMYGGTGLGLSICRRLAEIMDGSIELDSKPGVGSTFGIVLALQLADAPVTAMPSAKNESRPQAVQPLFSASNEAPLVLAVDDTLINRSLLARQIKMLGLRSETASNGIEALALWRKGSYSLIITDCHMPEMDGYELSQAIRKIEATEALPHTPIIAWTANALAEESDLCHGAGMDDLLVKPTELVTLRRALSKWLSIADTNSTPPPPSPDKVPATTPIDYAVLGMIIADDAAQAQLLHKFQSHIRTEHAKLTEAVELANLDHVQNVAHRMKGSCRMIGANPLAQACEDIEHVARQGDLPGTSKALSAVDTALRLLGHHLNMAGMPGEAPGTR